MRPIPIFDTNIFGHVQQGLISVRDWRYLLRKRPGRGWPLSSVTALELLVGVHYVPPDKFLQLKGQVNLAWNLCNGRVLEDPRFLLCTRVLHVPFPPDQVPPCAKVLAKHLDVLRHAGSRSEILEGHVPYRLSITHGNGRAGFQTSVLRELVKGPKQKWIAAVEALASDVYPSWRELFEETGKRLPPEKRKEFESPSTWEPERARFSESLLRWLGASTQPQSIAEIMKRFDAVLEFTIFVSREFLTRNYSPEKHHSDVYDQFQLQYLAMDRFVIVTGDTDLSMRTRESSQANRIMSFERFLETL